MPVGARAAAELAPHNSRRCDHLELLRTAIEMLLLAVGTAFSATGNGGDQLNRGEESGQASSREVTGDALAPECS